MQVTRLTTKVFGVPTDLPGGDGTATWDSTTMVLVELETPSGHRGLGYTYGAAAAADVVHETLADTVLGADVDDVRAIWAAMVASVRNAGRQGIAATAISAVDAALWDLRARLAGQALFVHLGASRREAPIYGSGGLTTYTEAQLVRQLAGWVEQGIPRVKMKIGKDRGRSAGEDLERVAAARNAIGEAPELFVDANGAYTAKQAVELAGRFRDQGVSYFEEPVSSDQLDALSLIRRMVPMDVAAGEYGYDPWYFRSMLAAGAVDILQADATRCLGVTGWMMVADLAYAAGIPFSAHCGPALHAHLGCAAAQLSHIEYFHDHARLEGLLFEGSLSPAGGALAPDPASPGLGLELKKQDARAYLVEERSR